MHMQKNPQYLNRMCIVVQGEMDEIKENYTHPI